MKPAFTAAVSLAALLLAPGSAPLAAEDAAPAQSQRQCFWSSNVNGFNAIDDTTVTLSVGAKDVYRLDLFAPCPDVKWTETLAIRTRGGGSSICSGLDAEIIAPSNIGPRTCQVSNIQKLTPEEAAALRAKKKS